MFLNYLKIALRNLKKNKLYSVINISGLALGMTCCLLIFIYVQFQLSYDNFHKKADQIYQVRQSTHASTPAPLGPAIKGDFPEILDYVRTDYLGNKVVSYGDKRFYERWFMVADPSIFDIFTFQFVKGDPETALRNPHSVVITESAAKKYFSNSDPIGKVLTYENKMDFQVTGVLQDIPLNSHLKFDFLASFARLNDFYGFNYLEHWGAWNFNTYLLLQKQFNPRTLEQKIPDFFRKHRGEGYADTALFLQPIKNIHLGGGKIRYIYLFSAIALIILLVACVNFMNLASAHSIKRTREVGLRKVLGAYRNQVIKQFLGESVILSCLAFPVSLVIVTFVLPSFSALVETPLSMSCLENYQVIAAIIGVIIFVGFVAGSYPALFLSVFKPAHILRGEILRKTKKLSLRNILVVAQFTISIIGIIGTLIVLNQLQYIRNKNLGINKEHVVTIPVTENIGERLKTIKTELVKYEKISSISGASYLPGSGIYNQSVWWEGMPEDEEPMLPWIAVDFDFIKTFEIELLEGRDFSSEFPFDLGNAYILNESAAKHIGWDSPIGKQFRVLMANNTRGKIVGKIKNFHFLSLHHEIYPLVLYLLPRNSRFLFVRISSEDIPNTIAFIRNTWDNFVPDRPFDYFFFDESFDRLYANEQKLGQIFSYFTFLSIFIACLGLFGLASFIVQQRRREIGIRKVFGAKVVKIVMLLSKQFIILVLIANIIAWPIVYYFMNRWLQDFAYRININPLIFIISAAIVIGISLLTISYQTVKAAVTNPVNSLRYE